MSRKQVSKEKLEALAEEIVAGVRSDWHRPENPFSSRRHTSFDDFIKKLAGRGFVYEPFAGRLGYRLLIASTSSPALWVESGGYEIIFRDLRFAQAAKKAYESMPHWGANSLRLVKEVE